MSSEKNTKPVVPIAKPEVGKIYENSKNIPKPTTKQPTQTPAKKGK